MLNMITRTGEPAGKVEYIANSMFSPIELQVLRLAAAHGERPGTALDGIRQRLIKFAVAPRASQALADPRLEALRSYVAARRHGQPVAPDALLAHGYSIEQLARIDSMHPAMQRSRAAHRDQLMYGTGIALGMASMMGFVVMTGVMMAGL